MSTAPFNSTQTQTQTQQAPRIQPMRHMEEAWKLVKQSGLSLVSKKGGEDTTSNYAVGLLHELLPFGDTELNAIISTMRDVDQITDIISENLEDMVVSDGHIKIAKNFDSIRKDSQRIYKQIESGNISSFANMRDSWMKATRGDIPSRFRKIREEADKVNKASDETLTRLNAMTKGYEQARLGLQGAVMLAEGIMKRAHAALEVEQSKLNGVLQELEGMQMDNPLYNQRILARDAQTNVTLAAKNRFQIAEDLYTEMTTGYHSGDVVMMKVRQMNDALKRVHQKSVAFINNNKITLTSLNISHSVMRQMHNATQAMKLMKEGINENLQTIGTLGNKTMLEAVREGNSATINAESIRQLIENIMTHQEESAQLEAEIRAQTAENTRLTREYAENARTRMANLTAKLAANSVTLEKVDSETLAKQLIAETEPTPPTSRLISENAEQPSKSHSIE